MVCFFIPQDKLEDIISEEMDKNQDEQSNWFKIFSHQKKLPTRTDVTNDILVAAKALLKEAYNGELIRLIGVRVDGLVEKEELQLSMFDVSENSKDKRLDSVIDSLKEKFGYDAVSRATDLKGNNKE